MNNLEFKTLSSDGYVITIEPSIVRNVKTEKIVVSFNTHDDEQTIAPASGIKMVKFYQDHMVIIPFPERFYEYEYKKIFPNGKGEIVIKSTDDNKAWYLQWRPSMTALIRYTIHNPGTNREKWFDEEALLFVGKTHGYEEVAIIKGDVEQTLDLYDLMPYYAAHYDGLLSADREN